MELSKFFGRISEGLYVVLKVLLSASDGSCVSEMIRMSSWVLCVSSASSALTLDAVGIYCPNSEVVPLDW